MAESLLPYGQNILPDNHAQAWAVVTGLITEYAEDAEYYINLAEIGESIFEWGDYPPPNLTDATQQDKLRINEIQNTVISQQPLEPAKITLDPVETGEPALVYFAGGPEKAMMLAQPRPMVDPATGAPMMDQAGQPALQPGLLMLAPEQISETSVVDPQTGQPITLPQQPVSREQGKLLLDLVDQGMLDEADVAEIDDQSTAKLFQKPFDVFWTRSRTNTDLDEFWLKKSIAGYGVILYEFNDETKRHEHTILPLRAVYMDPTETRIDKSSYAGVIRVMEKDKAIAKYPQYAEQIAECAGQTPQQVANQRLPAQWDRNYQRDMVTLVTHWQRNVDIPLDPQEAMDAKKVTKQQFATGEQEINGTDPATGMPVLAEVMREAYVGGDGQETTPGDGTWPTRKGILQLTMIDGVVIEEKECETWDIPLVHCPNILVPGKPFGGSETIKLWSQQRSLTTILESIRKNSRYYQAPTLHVPNSTYQAMKAAGLELHTKPGGIVIYEDDVWSGMGGKPPVPTDPPAIPASLIQAEGIIRAGLHEDSARSEVARGNMPSSQASGKTIGLLLQANNTANEGKGKAMVEALYRLSMLHLYSLVTRLTVDDLFAVVSRYPKNILAVYLDWARRVEWNTAVSVSMGGSQMALTKQQNALMRFQSQVQGLTTTQLELDIDPQQEERREEQVMKRKARLMAQYAPAPQEEPKKEKANG